MSFDLHLVAAHLLFSFWLYSGFNAKSSTLKAFSRWSFITSTLFWYISNFFVTCNLLYGLYKFLLRSSSNVVQTLNRFWLQTADILHLPSINSFSSWLLTAPPRPIVGKTFTLGKSKIRFPGSMYKVRSIGQGKSNSLPDWVKQCFGSTRPTVYELYLFTTVS